MATTTIDGIEVLGPTNEDIPTSTQTGTVDDSDGSSDGSSNWTTGAKEGAGLGIGLGILLSLALAGSLLWYYRLRRTNCKCCAEEWMLAPNDTAGPNFASTYTSQSPQEISGRELNAVQPYEFETQEAPQELQGCRM